MPNSATYSYFYFLGTTLPDSSTIVGGYNDTTNTITDSEDGLEDGMTTVGQNLDWSQSTQTVSLAGTTTSGEPVVAVAGGVTTYFLLSNSDGHDGTNLGFQGSGIYVYCFAAGTRIAMADGGDQNVQDLKIGELIKTADGSSTAVKWVGRKTVHKLFCGDRMQPVCIQAGAIGDGLPTDDLIVTADHAMIIDGVAVNAAALVNGSTIHWVPMKDLPDQVTYYHVETERHDVILANGAASESFVDSVTRANFDNYQQYLDLYGADRFIPEMELPRVMSQRTLPNRIRNRLGLSTEAKALNVSKAG